MSQTLIKSIIKCLIDTIIAVEYSNEHTIDEDSAVGILEQVRVELQELSAPDKAILTNLFNEISQHYPLETANFIKGMPSTLGIND